MSEPTRFLLRFAFWCFLGAWCFLCGVGLGFDVRRWLKGRQQTRQRFSERVH